MGPRHNNVYGQIVAPDGLRPVLRAVEAVAGPGCASAYRDRASDTERLRLRSDTADLESLPLPGGMEHLFNGAVAGSTESVLAFVRALSGALTKEGIDHNFEVLDREQKQSWSVP
jgi:hypothetical protein